MSNADTAVGSAIAVDSRGTKVAPLVTMLLLVVLAGAAAYFALFSSFAPYDDEGYVLLSLRSVMAGHPLYDETFTQYGPGYYAVQSAGHWLLGLPVSHDVARWKTLAAWLAAALFAGAFVYRLTTSRMLAVVALAATFLHLDRLGLEPGHPQDLVIPLLAGSLWLASRMDWGVHSQRRFLFLGLGVTTGLLLTTKINCGVLAGLATTAALVWLLPVTRLSIFLRVLTTVAGMLLPWALARHHVLSWEGAALPVAIAIGWVGVLVQFRARAPQPVCELRQLWTYWFSSAATTSGFCLYAVAQGTTWSGLWYGLVEQHRLMPDVAYHHPPLPDWWPVAACLGLWLALRARCSTVFLNWGRGILAGLLGLIALRTLGETWVPITHGLDDRAAAGALLAVALPLACLGLPSLIAPFATSATPGLLFARLLLVASALVQPLMTYPTPGTQIAIGSWPVLLLAIVVLGDLLRFRELTSIADEQADRQPEVARLPLPTLWRLPAFAIAATVCITVGLRARAGHSQWSKCESLNLPGATALRLPPEEAATRRAAVAYLQAQGDTFVATPTGCCSFYLWTGMEPPTTFNTTYWTVLLTPEQQTEVIDQLRASSAPLVLVDRRQRPVKHTQAPLHQYLSREYATVWHTGQYEIQAPRTQTASQR